MLTVLNILLIHPLLTVELKKTEFLKIPHFKRITILRIIGKSHFHNQSKQKVTKFAQILLMVHMLRVGTLVSQTETLFHFFKRIRYHRNLQVLLNLIFLDQFHSEALESQAKRQVTENHGFV